MRLFAQIPDSTKSFHNSLNKQAINMGHLYGKIVDSKSNKGMEAASVQLIASKFNPSTQIKKDTIIAGMLTEANGDFSLDNLPIMGKFKLIVTAIGYKTYNTTVSFDIDMSDKDMQKILGNVDKDLGNIKLEIEGQNLTQVVITGTKPLFQLGIDRKIFNVDKNLTSTGQTATEIMRNIPSVNVDIDGNVTLRGAAPQLFVDGRPTVLSLDQIPADAIESVELITNPSAKYDASGGGAGILNIVLKKNKKIGYNGNLRLGIDSRARLNGGGDINVKQGKWNFSASMLYKGRKSITDGFAFRQNTIDIPKTNLTQKNDLITKGYFGFGHFSIDYLASNRTTFTLSQHVGQGKMDNYDTLNFKMDSLYSSPTYETANRYTLGKINFKHYTTTLAFKHTFPKKGHEITADATFQVRSFKNNTAFSNQYYLQNGTPKGNASNQLVLLDGLNKRLVVQVDYSYPIKENTKIETGLRTSIRKAENNNTNYINDVLVKAASNNYIYNEQVYAGYINYMGKIKTFSYQLGLRAESSVYDGKLTNTGKSFSNRYINNIFPNASLTKNLNDNQDIQLNYTRRIERPNFFQLSPYIDYTDTLNLNKGNPDLKPEFANVLELSYSNNFNNNYMLMVTLFYKYSNDIVTRYQTKETNPISGKDVILNTYINANSSQNYGIELTNKSTVATWLDIMPSINIYNSSINSSNISAALNNQRWSWFGKLNTTIKIPNNWNIQLSGDYQSETVLPQNTGGGGRPGDGGGPFMSLGGTTSQGYIKPNYGIDIAIKKDFLKNRAISATLSVSDIFKTRKYAAFSESPFFTQDVWRRRDWQLIQLNLNYRFGKVNANLFKRKNTKATDLQDGMGM